MTRHNGAQEQKLGAVQITIGVLEVVKAAVWPVAILFIFFWLSTPLINLLNKMPDIAGRADVISMGDFKIQMNREFEIQATSDIKDALAGLAAQDISRILTLTQATYVLCDFGHSQNQLQREIDNRLAAHKLVLLEHDVEPSEHQDGGENCFRTRSSELGERTQAFLIKLLASSLKL